MASGLLCASFAALGLGAASQAATLVIHAGHLIAEPGKPSATDVSIVITDGKIVAVKSGSVAGDQVIELKDSWVMPGMMDMHTHISGVERLDQPAGPQIALLYLSRPAETVLNTLPRAKAMLMDGFTTIRNVGDPSFTTYSLRDAITNGIVPGPRMLVAEAQISVAGGDYDASSWGLRTDMEKYLQNRGNCSGTVECIKVVRDEVHRGADLIKFRQAGLPAEDPRVKMVESPEEIKAIIDTAHQLGRRVAVHTNGSPEFLRLAVEAGADTIEHGPLDDTSIALMKKRGTSFTPTLLAAKMIEYRFDEAMSGAGKAYRAGVPIIFGTDLGIMTTDRSHEEFALLAAAGLPPAQVLRTATTNAAAALGRPDLGVIGAGKLADIIAFKFDPEAHLDQVGAPGQVSFVMKEGVVYKDER
jgi:imidazolonepropionase-like amidohydrolase